MCVDGHKETNHIQSKHKMVSLERNMNAFSEAVGEYAYRAKWVYIVFDLNEHELEIAREHAKRLGSHLYTYWYA